jgi:transcription-repair coupling factor (superfamily II helicase)
MKSLFSRLTLPLETQLLQRQEVFSHLNLTQEAMLLIDSFIKHPRPMLIIKPNLYQAQLLYERLQIFLNEDVVLYSQEDSLRVEEIAMSFQNQSEKIKTLIKVLQNDTIMVVSHVGAVTRKIPDKAILKSSVLNSIFEPRVFNASIRNPSNTRRLYKNNACRSTTHLCKTWIHY